MATPSYLGWLVDTGERQATACGREIEIWKLNPQDDAEILSNWARHFRQHYIADADLPFMAGGTGLGHPDYLRTILFPDAKVAPGPSLRSGDFGEIVVADKDGVVVIPHDQFDHVVETLPKVREAEENLTRKVRLGLDNSEEVRAILDPDRTEYVD